MKPTHAPRTGASSESRLDLSGGPPLQQNAWSEPRCPLEDVSQPVILPSLREPCGGSVSGREAEQEFAAEPHASARLGVGHR